MKDAYDQSVTRALRSACKSSRVPIWTRLLLDKMYNHVPCVVPYDLIAVGALEVQAAMEFNGSVLRIKGMLEKGWGLETSVMMWRNFRMAHPVLRFDAEAFRCFNREQIVEELGHTYGNLIADVIADPTCQPVFSALLFNEVHEPVWRQFCTYVWGVPVDEGNVRRMEAEHRWPVGCKLHTPELTHKQILDSGTMLATQEAISAYSLYTGHHLVAENDIHPRTLCYEATAIRAAVQQVDRPFYTYEKGPDSS